MKRFTQLAISDPKQFVYGRAVHPVETRHGLKIGGGTVYPELNFTLPPMLLEDSTAAQARKHYEQMIGGVLERAYELNAPGVVVEFETLPPMTARPEWGIDICKMLLEHMEDCYAQKGLKSALRMTPNDNREMIRPPQMRDGCYWETMLETFDQCAAAGAELLSIESVGGKEVHDIALTYGDIGQVLFSLCVMGVRDMHFLWGHIEEIAKRHGVYAAGDTACGFANTAMVLAEQKMIPRVFAATVRAISAVRSLAAYECGAVGPGKDCGYENIFLKAITGYPMSMEGKAAACAHLSPLGNIAAATCDLWSNESVQNIKLLGGMAPTVSMEQLIYDCRLMNQASKESGDAALQLRDWLVDSDARLDPQAYILTPENAITVAQTIVDADSAYHAGIAAGLKTIEILRQGYEHDQLTITDRDYAYLDIMESTIQSLPDDEDRFIEGMMSQVETDKFIAADYQLRCPCCH